MKHDNKIVKVFSPERLSSYKTTTLSSDIDAIAAHAWNMAICASFYPLLQSVEICFRNSIHEAMRELFSDNFWFKNPRIISQSEIKMVNYTIANIQQRHRLSDANHIISELNFGFWTALLSRRYERVVWHKLIKVVFPHIPKTLRTRGFIHQRFRAIRKLRNRVFHHQRIWHMPELLMLKREIVEAIYWIEPSVVDFLSVVDDVEQIYHRGIKFYKNKLLNL